MIRFATFILVLAAAKLLSVTATPSSKPSCTTDSESGTQVCQISSEGTNTIVYYDTPLYSARYNRIVYVHHEEGQPPEVMLANLDGTHTEVLTPGRDCLINSEGTKVYFVWANASGEPGQDIYAIDLATRRRTRVTHSDAHGDLQWSPPAVTPRGDLFVYAPDNVAHLVYGDGSGDTPLKFGDPYSSSPFHRIRISPTHPNLIFYNRQVRPPVYSEKLHRPLFPLWVYDTENERTYEVSDIATHMLWAPDGIHIGYDGGGDYRFHLARYDGTDNRVLTPGPEQTGRFTEYCTFAPEADVLACANSDISGRLPLSGSLFLLTADGSDRVAYVCKHNAKIINYWGYPALIFADRQHLVFRSDATGVPQVYVAILPAEIFSRLRPLSHSVSEQSLPERSPPARLRHTE